MTAPRVAVGCQHCSAERIFKFKIETGGLGWCGFLIDIVTSKAVSGFIKMIMNTNSE